jgi:hypothetical protein
MYAASGGSWHDAGNADRGAPRRSEIPPVASRGRGSDLAGVPEIDAARQIARTPHAPIAPAALAAVEFPHSGPPKNPALPGSVASAEIPGPRRLTAKFKRLQKTATSYPYCVLAGLVPAKTPGPHPFLVPMGRRAGDCRIATLLAMTDSSQCSTVFFSCQEGGGARHSGPPLAIRNA